MRHFRLVAASAAVLATTAGVAQAQADLAMSYTIQSDATVLQAELVKGSGNGFLLMCNTGNAGMTGSLMAPVNRTSGYRLLTVGLPFDEETEQATFTLPPLGELPQGFSVDFTSVFFEDGGLGESDEETLVFNQMFCQTLDFDWGYGGVHIQAGEPVDEQWADMGLHIETESTVGVTDQAIVLDSTNPRAPNSDLITPGYGTNNDTAQGMLLVVAENLDDANTDGYVDEPGHDPDGGTIRLFFDEEVTACRLTVIDVDLKETVIVKGFDADDNQIAQIRIHAQDDNSSQTVGLNMEGVRQLAIRINGAAAVADVEFIPCRDRREFDTTLTGIPLGLDAGTALSTQMNAVEVVGFNTLPGSPQYAVTFDSANPTGTDDDLVAPGYGIGNTEPLGNIVILPENELDANGDGVLDDPDDSAAGGTISLKFDADITFLSGTAIDIDTYETGAFELFDKFDELITVLPLSSLGDNSVETVEAEVSGVRRVNLVLSGSGGLVSVEYCPE